MLNANNKVTFSRIGGGINRLMNRIMPVGLAYELRQSPSRAPSHIIVTNVWFNLSAMNS